LVAIEWEHRMRVEVMQHFGLTVPFERAGYYDSAHHQALVEKIRGAITEGRLIAICGVIGSGKTALLHRLQQLLEEDGKITVSRSLAIEKHRLKLGDFITALLYDLSTEPPARIPSGEKRERELRERMRKNQKPVALFIDDAHELNRRALTELGRLMKLIESDGGRLAVVLAGQPTLRKDLRHATRKEFGDRTDVFSLEGMAGSQRDYIRWLLKACTADQRAAETILTEEAIDVLASKLRTPLQIQRHLSLALQASYQVGERPGVR
jgi:type II secretory pathway predicted ATPase ExeA